MEIRGCMAWTNGKEEYYYIAQTEMFTLQIDHSFVAQFPETQWIPEQFPDTPGHHSVTANVFEPTVSGGAIIGQDGKELDPCQDYTDEGFSSCDARVNVGKPCPRQHTNDTSNCRDIIPIRTLLRAAGLYDAGKDALDTMSNYTKSGKPQSNRFAGMMILVTVQYSGDTSGKYTYTYHAKYVNYYSADEATFHGNTQKTVLDRHGIHLAFAVSHRVSRNSQCLPRRD